MLDDGRSKKQVEQGRESSRSAVRYTERHPAGIMWYGTVCGESLSNHSTGRGSSGREAAACPDGATMWGML